MRFLLISCVAMLSFLLPACSQGGDPPIDVAPHSRHGGDSESDQKLGESAVRIKSMQVGSYIGDDFSVGGSKTAYSGADAIFVRVDLIGRADDVAVEMVITDESGHTIMSDQKVVSVNESLGVNFTLTRAVRESFSPGRYIVSVDADGAVSRVPFDVS